MAMVVRMLVAEKRMSHLRIVKRWVVRISCNGITVRALSKQGGFEVEVDAPIPAEGVTAIAMHVDRVTKPGMLGSNIVGC